ncbi:MAG: sulfotransferase [Planctomycetota bacterium]|nr:sulfotransferase [Planctomycetota bacterium]
MPLPFVQKLLPYARYIKYMRNLKRAQADAGKPNGGTPLINPVSFVVGCGRSGTTITGKLLTQHREVHYLREPYHLWRAIDPSTDMVRLFGEGGVEPRCIFDETDATASVKERFKGCMQGEQARGTIHKKVIEKTPIHAMRIPLLHACSADSNFLHLVRNGLDVVQSVDRLSQDSDFGVAGKGKWNRWWGRDKCKWDALKQDAIKYGYFENEVPHLHTDIEMGALEWLISLMEIQKHRELLGSALLEITYKQLTTDTKSSFEQMSTHFGIEPYDEWMSICLDTINPPRKYDVPSIQLPTDMCVMFNELQEYYGFVGRATS